METATAAALRALLSIALKESIELNLRFFFIHLKFRDKKYRLHSPLRTIVWVQSMLFSWSEVFLRASAQYVKDLLNFQACLPYGHNIGYQLLKSKILSGLTIRASSLNLMYVKYSLPKYGAKLR